MHSYITHFIHIILNFNIFIWKNNAIINKLQ